MSWPVTINQCSGQKSGGPKRDAEMALLSRNGSIMGPRFSLPRGGSPRPIIRTIYTLAIRLEQ